MWPIYCLLWRNCSASFQGFFRVNCSIHSCRSNVSMGGSEFRIFLCRYLGHTPLSFEKSCFLEHPKWFFMALFLWLVPALVKLYRDCNLIKKWRGKFKANVKGWSNYFMKSAMCTRPTDKVPILTKFLSDFNKISINELCPYTMCVYI